MGSKVTMLVANFTCRVGEKVLLDVFDELIYPAFFESPPRKYGNNTFYFFDLSITDSGDGIKPEPVLSGRFLRDMNLRRSHKLEGENIVPDKNQMESATFARFVLVLSTHTLLYVPETSFAPPVSMFASTIAFHLKKRWAKYVIEIAKNRRKDDKTKTLLEWRTEVVSEHPAPELKIVELPSNTEIDKSVKKFSKIDQVKYVVNDTNHSLDFSPLINGLREQKDKTKSSSLVVIEKSPKNKSAITKQLSDVIKDGNVEAELKGLGINGEKLTCSNDDMKISVSFGKMPAAMSRFITQAVTIFQGLIDSKEINVTKAPSNYKQTLSEIASKRKP